LSIFVLLEFLAAQESDKRAKDVQADLVPAQVHLMHAHLIEYLDDLSYIDQILRVISSHRILFSLDYYTDFISVPLTFDDQSEALHVLILSQEKLTLSLHLC
jgi:hypothetical protein